MSVVIKKGNAVIATEKFDTKIPAKKESTLFAYNNALYPTSYKVLLDEEKAFFFKPEGGEYTQEYTNYAEIKNQLAKATIPSAEAGELCSVVGVYANENTREITVGLVSYDYRATDRTEFSIHRFNTTAGTVSSVNVFESASYLPALDPDSIAVFPEEDTIVFVANTGDGFSFYSVPLSGALTSASSIGDVIAGGDYNVIRARCLRVSGDHAFVSGYIDGASVTQAAFVTHLPAPIISVEETIEESGAETLIWHTNSTANADAAHLIEFDGDIPQDGNITLCAIVRNSSAGLFATTISYFASEDERGRQDMAILATTKIKNATGTPIQSVSFFSSKNKNIFFSSNHFGGTALDRLSLRDSSRSVYDVDVASIVYSPDAADADSSPDNGPAGNDFSFQVRVLLSMPASDVTIIALHDGSATGAGQVVSKIWYDISEDSFVLSTWDYANSTFVDMASIEANDFDRKETLIRFDRTDGALSAKINNIVAPITAGAGKAMVFLAGNYASFYQGASATDAVHFSYFLVSINNAVVYGGIPGQPGSIQGYSQGFSPSKVLVESLTVPYTFTQAIPQRMSFYEDSDDTYDAFIPTTSVLLSRMSIYAGSYLSTSGTVLVSGGNDGGINDCNLLAVARFGTEDTLYPIYEGTETPNSTTPKLIFSRMTTNCSYECNGASIAVCFDGASETIEAEEVQTDILHFIDTNEIGSMESPLNLYGFPYEVAQDITATAYALVIAGQDFKDFYQKGTTVSSVAGYALWRGETGVDRFDYSEESGLFYLSDAGRYVAMTVEQTIQTEGVTFSGYGDGANVLVSGTGDPSIQQDVIEATAKVKPSAVSTAFALGVDTNYADPESLCYFKCDPLATAALNADATPTEHTVIFDAAAQVRVMRTNIDQRADSFAFKPRLLAEHEDAQGVEQFDDWAAFGITVKPSPGIVFDGYGANNEDS